MLVRHQNQHLNKQMFKEKLTDKLGIGISMKLQNEEGHKKT